MTGADVNALSVGWIGPQPSQGGAGIAETWRLQVHDQRDLGVFSTGEHSVWVVDVEADEVMARAAVASDAAVVLRVRTENPDGWYWGALSSGRVDLVDVAAPAHELQRRVAGLAARARAWTPVCGQLATTAAHDLRSPLQGLKSTLTNLAHESESGKNIADSIAMLETVADAFELQLHGLYNLGRRLMPDRGDVVDLCAALREELTRPMFHRVDAVLTGDLPVHAHAGDLRYALLDMLRVAVQVSPSSKRVQVTTGREGDLATVTVVAPVYASIGVAAEATLTREGAMWLRPNPRLPLSGVAFVSDVARACEGSFSVAAPEPTRIVFTLRLPLAP